MHEAHVAIRSALHGIRRVPSVVVDGQVAACCVDSGVIESVLRAAITRTP